MLTFWAVTILLSGLLLSWSTGNVSFAQEEDEDMPILMDNSLAFELVSDGLSDPTGMAFLGEDDILVTEKSTGTVQRVLNGEILDEPLLDVNVNAEDERGLLGIAVSKNESNDKTYVFLYYTEADGVAAETGNGSGDEDGEPGDGDGGEPIGNRLYRYELSEDGRGLVNPKLLLDLPYEPGPAHTGGTIAIGPDNHIYLAVGDMTPTSYGEGDFKFKVQNYQDGDDPDGRAGIIRITQEGQAVDSIFGKAHPLDMYYAYGIRNSFGIAFDPLTGKLWDTENGPSFGDELNLVEPGFNSGWAKVLGIWNVEEVIDEEGNRDIRKGEAIPLARNMNESLISFNGSGEYSSPELTWDQTIAPTAIAFLNSSNLGVKYENDMFVGTAKDRLLRFVLAENRSELMLDDSNADKVVDTEAELENSTFAENLGIISDVDVGPDGYLYILTGVREAEGKIYRIVPSQELVE